VGRRPGDAVEDENGDATATVERRTWEEEEEEATEDRPAVTRTCER
jgi:hypothetical protein